MGWFEQALEGIKPAGMSALFWVPASGLALLGFYFAGVWIDQFIDENPAWRLPVIAGAFGLAGVVFGFGCWRTLTVRAGRWTAERSALQERIRSLEEGAEHLTLMRDRACDLAEGYQAEALASLQLAKELRGTLKDMHALKGAPPLQYGASGLEDPSRG